MILFDAGQKSTATVLKANSMCEESERFSYEYKFLGNFKKRFCRQLGPPRERPQQGRQGWNPFNIWHLVIGTSCLRARFAIPIGLRSSREYSKSIVAQELPLCE